MHRPGRKPGAGKVRQIILPDDRGYGMSKKSDENTTLRAEAEARLARAQLPEVAAPPARVLMHELRVYRIEIASNAIINTWPAYVSIRIPGPDYICYGHNSCSGS